MTDRDRPPVDVLIDHAAAMQRQIDRIDLEMFIVLIAATALAIAVSIMGWRLWRE